MSRGIAAPPGSTTRHESASIIPRGDRERNARRLGLRLLALVACGAVLSATARAAEDGELTDETVVVKTEGPHRLLLPQDWPVERREDGVIAPVGTEEYLSLKFGQVRDAVERLDRRLEALERRLEALEAGRETTERRLRWLEEEWRVRAEASAP